MFDAGEAKGVLFIAMRFVHGGDVRTLLDAVGPLPAARAADITSQVASALDAAHARGLVHRDVKPANMLLDATAGGGDRQDHVYLSDFGLSKQSLSQTGLTAQGQFLGTLDYVAPEQVEGRAVDGRADQYALACASFELLAGTPPFKRGEGLAVVWAKLSEDPPLLSPRREDLPAAIDDVMTRGMARVAAERFTSCGEFAAALRDVLGLRSPDSGPRSVSPVSRPPTEIAMPAVPPAAPASAPGVAAPAGASSEAGPAASLAAGSAALAGAGAPPGHAAPSGPPPASAEPSGPAGPPTEVARVAGSRSTRPGLTEPSPQPGYRPPADYPVPPDYRAAQSGPSPVRRVNGPRGAGTVVAPRPHPSWWRSRAFLAAAAAVVVLGVAGGVFAALHHAAGSTGTGGGHGTSPVAAALTAPGCTTTAASAHQLSGVRTQTTALGGSPFGVAVTPDGKYSFVSLGNSIAVLRNHNGSLAATQVTPVPAAGAQKTLAITHDGQYLLAAANSGAYVISVAKAEAGDGSGAVLGTLPGPPGNPSNEVLASADGKLAFITFQNHGDVAVFNLQQAIDGGFGQAGVPGTGPARGRVKAAGDGGVPGRPLAVRDRRKPARAAVRGRHDQGRDGPAARRDDLGRGGLRARPRDRVAQRGRMGHRSGCQHAGRLLRRQAAQRSVALDHRPGQRGPDPDRPVLCRWRPGHPGRRHQHPRCPETPAAFPSAARVPPSRWAAALHRCWAGGSDSARKK